MAVIAKVVDKVQRLKQSDKEIASPVPSLSFWTRLAMTCLVVLQDVSYRLPPMRCVVDAVSYSNLRQNLKSYCDKIYHDHDPMIITRKNGENLVMLSVEAYSSLVETSYLLGTPANADHLRLSIQQWRDGQAQTRDLLSDE